MTIVVLFVLAVIWGVVLIPPMLRTRAESRPADSIGSFRHQLGVLRRTAPNAFSPANSLWIPNYASPTPAPTYHMARSYSRVDPRRSRTLKRRRDILLILVMSMGITLVLGIIPTFHAVLGLHVLCDALFAGYVALLIRARNASAERDMKLRFLPTAAAPDNIVMLRRSAN